MWSIEWIAQVTEQGLLACLGNAPEPITLWKITETTQARQGTLAQNKRKVSPPEKPP